MNIYYHNPSYWPIFANENQKQKFIAGIEEKEILREGDCRVEVSNARFRRIKRNMRVCMKATCLSLWSCFSYHINSVAIATTTLLIFQMTAHYHNEPEEKKNSASVGIQITYRKGWEI